jgi:TetR/AcrR family transcriptional regulator, cholesterol catabolism regulator
MFPVLKMYLPLTRNFLNMDEAKIKILQGAETLFLRYGFKSITMDDVSRELGISKKTLYQYFTDKNDLVNQTVENHLNKEKHYCLQLVETEKDPIAFLLAISENFGDEAKHISAAVLFDLRKYFKEAWDKIDAYSKEFIYSQVLQNLQQGKEKGWYRKDMNDRVIALYYVNMIHFMVNPDNYQKEVRDFATVHHELVTYHLHGILTEKGMKQLEKLISNKK